MSGYRWIGGVDLEMDVNQASERGEPCCELYSWEPRLLRCLR